MKCLPAFFILLLHFVQPSHAANIQPEIERELKNYIYSQVVAFQPKNVGFQQFANSLSSNSTDKNWHELISVSRQVKAWPLIRLENGHLQFKVGAQTYILEITDLKEPSIKINGHLFHLNSKESYLQQSKSFVEQLESKKTVFQLLIPDAYARTNDPASATTMVAPTIVGAIGGAIVGIGAAAGAGTVAPAAAVGAIGGAAIGTVVCTGVQLMLSGETFWDRYLNCVSAPLSLVRLNPRDQLKFKKFKKCSANLIQVEVASASGFVQIREFEFAEGVLQYVHILEPREDFRPTTDSSLKTTHDRAVVANFRADASGYSFIQGKTIKDNRVTTELSQAQLKDLQSLVRDAELYKGVCADPARKAKFESGNVQDSSPTQMRPTKLHESGVK